MADDSPPPSPSRGVITLHSHSEHDWQPILHSSNQVVLYNPKSHALSISRSSSNLPLHDTTCPYCKRTLPEGFERDPSESDDRDDIDPTYHTRRPEYFQLLAIANETSSDTTPLTAHGDIGQDRIDESTRGAFPPGTMAEGYFKTFFQEEYKLGMGANGSVHLCQHVLDGNPLGHFAVKKIAIGESHSYLLQILREVRLLERLHHPNIITYHHAWLETCQFSSFGLKVPTLYVLMQWAEGGSLDDFIDIRLGRGSPHVHINPFGAFPPSLNPPTTSSHRPFPRTTSSNDLSSPGSDIHSRSARIRAFRAFQRASPEERERMRREILVTNGNGTGKKAQSLKAVHLLSADEVKSLFSDVVEGLNFLHDRSILHLDLKPGNVLLTWDEGKLIPRAMLSDFGTSRDMIASDPARSGNTGTLEYSSPESLPSPQTGLLHKIDSKSDMWSLGMILHKLLFFKLPYRYAAEGDNGEPLSRPSRIDEREKLKHLEQEILNYPGFKSNSDLVTAFKARRLPRTFLLLLEGLLNKVPNTRPACERVAIAIKEGKLDPLKDAPQREGISSLVPLSRSFLGRDTRDPPSIAGQESGMEDDLGHGDARESDDGSVELDVTSREKAPILSLPSPLESFDSEDSQQHATYPRASGWRVRLLRAMIQHRELLLRLMKSCILIGKVLNITSICPGPHVFPRIWILSPLLGAALVDAVVEMGFVAHMGFLVLHVLGVRVVCAYERCCP